MPHDTFTKGLRGEFRGDFTRDTFDPLRRFSRVLMQQGRVQLDADWNEQVSIFSHYHRQLAIHLMGPHGAPAKQDGTNPLSFQGEGFLIKPEGVSFNIHSGAYYVQGILCENEKNRNYYDQPDYPFKDDEKIPLLPGKYLVYLDVWERHLSYIEDDYIREKALNGSDTTTRAKLVWQVKWLSQQDFPSEGEDDTAGIEIADFANYGMFTDALKGVKNDRPGTGQLRARAKNVSKERKDPCLISSDSRYRGAENQLYRVEIRNGGEIDNEENVNNPNTVTFNWSRENGSVVFPIVNIRDKEITLEHLGRDTRFALKPNDWVEIVNDDYVLRNKTEDLLQVDTVDMENSQVTLKDAPKLTIQEDSHKHPYLRRWDQKTGNGQGVPVRGGKGDDKTKWIELEDGIEIQFLQLDRDEYALIYQPGDYWLIPARTATGDVEWPGPEEAPIFLGAQGVDHHYAPLAKITVTDTDTTAVDIRRKIKPNWK